MDSDIQSGREYAPTKPFVPTKLNNQRVEIEVSEGLVKEGGMFSSSYVTYKISTKPLGWEIRRKDGDLFILRKILTK